MVCSSAFVTLGQSQAKALGMPDLPIAVIPHPFGLLTRAEVKDLAGRCVGQIAALMADKTS